MKQTKGIFTALLTPFDKNFAVKEKELEKLIQWNIQKGVTGFYVGGSTAEALLLTTDQRKQIMDVVKSTAPDHTLIAHIGSLNILEAQELGKHARKLSYDMVSSIAPFYYKFTFPEVKNYYFRLADSADLPMLIYHFPAFSGVNLGASEMREFLSDDRFIGIKYTSNDFFMLEQCKSAFPNKIVYNGFDEMLLAGLSMGADGGIGSTYNLIGEKYVAIQKLFSENRMEEARAVQKEANRIVALLCKIGVLQAAKEILNQIGFDFGVCKAPFIEPTPEEKEIIKKEIIPYLEY